MTQKTVMVRTPNYLFFVASFKSNIASLAQNKTLKITHSHAMSRSSIYEKHTILSMERRTRYILRHKLSTAVLTETTLDCGRYKPIGITVHS